MNVVARKQNEFTCPHLEGGTIVDSQLHVPRRDKMRGDDMSRGGQERFAIVGGDSSAQTPGRSELRLEEDPSRQPNHTQHIRKRIQHLTALLSGVRSRFSGAPVIHRLNCDA
ncbi:hypothetical protein D9M73_194490 [compost metagenome]